ncbi:MAG: hypothetical protein N3A62_05435 [Thermodesulfovibrionales bacterium]|nr:hypothetical protein [Thermodesulfovibrionales bacterium]
MKKNLLLFICTTIFAFTLSSCEPPPPTTENPYRPKEKSANIPSEKDFIVNVETKSLGKGENLFVFSITHTTIPNPNIGTVTVTIGRPTTNAFDRSFVANKVSDNRYMALIDLRDKWEWEVRVSFNFEDKTYSYKYTYYIY